MTHRNHTDLYLVPRKSLLLSTVLIPSDPTIPPPAAPLAASFCCLPNPSPSGLWRAADHTYMGNLISAGAAASASGGKVVMADGSVRALSEPVSVAELMMDHPRHFVVDARVLQQEHKGGGGGGRASKVAPLPADHVLGAGGVYVLLPATRGKVSAEEARRALTASRSLARSRSMPGGLRRKLSSKKSREEAKDADEPAKREAAAEVERTEEKVARPDGFEEHRPEFLSRELSSRGWKPGLRTIEERVMPKKMPHWLF